MNKEIVLNIDGSHNGYDYVDFGLPSCTKWATCNVGATKPEDEGLLFQFGLVDGYKYGDKKQKFFESKEFKTASGTEYDVCQKLNLDDDAAHANMGGEWIMPNKEDLKELYKNTTRQVMTINGKKGMLFTSKVNGKSIFVVFGGVLHYNFDEFYGRGCEGFLRSSEVSSIDDKIAWCLGFYDDGTCDISYYYQHYNAFSVRGVLK